MTCPDCGCEMDMISQWGEVVFVCPKCKHKEEMT
jgi:Zn-finger nucleic acid-binding protein